VRGDADTAQRRCGVQAGWTPFAGRTITGRVVRTYLGGDLVAEEGKPTAPDGSCPAADTVAPTDSIGTPVRARG
jgi:hypothetical protein